MRNQAGAADECSRINSLVKCKPPMDARIEGARCRRPPNDANTTRSDPSPWPRTSPATACSRVHLPHRVGAARCDRRRNRGTVQTWRRKDTGSRAGMPAWLPRFVGSARGCRVHTRNRCPCAASRRCHGVLIVERTAGFGPRLIRSGQSRAPAQRAASCPYIGRTLKELHTKRILLLTTEKISCHCWGVVCISRGVPDVEGAHLEAVREKRAWAVGSGCGIAGAAS
jgi:hypothetical protein